MSRQGIASGVPWVRTRIAHLPGIATSVTLLALVTAFLAAALPLQLDRYQDRALGAQLSHVQLDQRSIRFGSNSRSGVQSSQLWQIADAKKLADAQEQLGAEIEAPLTVEHSDEVAGIRTAFVGTQPPLSGLPLTGTGVAVLDGESPRLNLVWQPGAQQHVHFVQGRMPVDPKVVASPDGGLTGIDGPVEFAVNAQAAASLKLRLGAVYQLGPIAQGRLVGVYRADDARADWWLTSSHLTDATVLQYPRPQDDPIDYWYTDALTSSGTAAVMSVIAMGNTEVYWYFPLRTTALKGHQVDAARAEIDSLLEGDKATLTAGQAIPPGDLTATTGLDGVLQDWAAQRDALAPLITVGASGALGVAVVVLLMGLGIAADRRREELRLLRGRGASLRTLGLRLFAESAVYAGAGVLAGAGAAIVLLPNGRHATALLAAGGVWLFTVLAFPVRLLAGQRRVQARGRGEDVVRARPSRRRTVFELTVLVATVAAVVSLRRRGIDPAGGVDLLVTLAPLLLGLSGAILLVRLYPLPVRLLSRPTRGRRGAVGFLGLARAGRGSAGVTLLPLLAMLLALTVGAFGLAVLTGVQQARDAGATALVGADARISTDGTELAPALVSAAHRLAGVRDVTEVVAQRDFALGETTHADLFAVDPADYAALSRRTGRGAFDPALLHWDGKGPLPVLASPGAAAALGRGTNTLDSEFGPLQVRVVGSVDATPAQEANEFLVVPAAPALAAEKARFGLSLGPSTLLLTGTVRAADLRATVARHQGTGDTNLLVLAEERARLSDSPLQSGATALYLASVLATGTLCLLAVLLALLQAAPERSRLLARLRTMGLTPRQGYGLVLTESLPLVLLAAVAGTLLGLTAIPLLGSAVDLTALSGTAALGTFGVSSGLSAEPLPVLAPGAALLVLTAAVIAAEAALIGRRQIGAQLRVGDST